MLPHGQMVIQWAEKVINLEMNKIMKTSGVDYMIKIDLIHCI